MKNRLIDINFGKKNCRIQDKADSWPDTRFLFRFNLTQVLHIMSGLQKQWGSVVKMARESVDKVKQTFVILSTCL